MQKSANLFANTPPPRAVQFRVKIAWMKSSVAFLPIPCLPVTRKSLLACHHFWLTYSSPIAVGHREMSPPPRSALGYAGRAGPRLDRDGPGEDPAARLYPYHVRAAFVRRYEWIDQAFPDFE